MLWKVEVWERPWSLKARMQSVTTYLVEADNENEAPGKIKLDNYTLAQFDRFVVKPVRLPMMIGGHPDHRPRREGAEGMSC